MYACMLMQMMCCVVVGCMPIMLLPFPILCSYNGRVTTIIIMLGYSNITVNYSIKAVSSLYCALPTK